jgi:hypothetical protein
VIAIVARLLVLALPLNLAWELLQAPAYGPMGQTWLEGLLVCVRATLGDGLIFLGLFAAGAALYGRFWFSPCRVGRYAVIVGIAVAIQIAIEWAAVRAGRWQYAAWHPQVFGAGLFPILQVIVLVPLTFGLLSKWRRERGN